MVINLKFSTSCSLSPQTLTHIMISWCLKSILQNSYLQEKEVRHHIRADTAGGASQLVISKSSLLPISSKEHMYSQNYMCGMHSDTSKENSYLRVDSLSHCIHQPQRVPALPHQSERNNLEINERLTDTFIKAHLIGDFFYKKQRCTGPYKQRILRQVGHFIQ